MMIFNQRMLFFTMLCCCIQQVTYSQIGNYTRVNKIYRDTYNFIEEQGRSRGKQQKDKGLYIVYSDRDNNNTYLDALGLKETKKQAFLTPYFVIDEMSDFLELVKFDPSQLGKPKGILSFFYGNTYNFQDVKNVEYIGWIQKDKLLHFSHPKVSHINLKPITYYLGINNTKTLINLRKYIKNDSVFTYKNPDFSIKSKKAFNINQLVYLYKYNTDKTAALIANKKHLQISDSTDLVVGWVPAELLQKIGQRNVFKTNDKDLLVINYNNKNDTIFHFDIPDKFLFMPETKVTDSFAVTSYIPINIWNHNSNKLLNIRGKDIDLKEVPIMAEEQKTFNFHFIFDCSPSVRKKLILQIGALQNIWLLLNEDEQFKDKKFTFSASAYGCNSFYEFPKNESFALWLDSLQNAFFNTKLSSSGKKTNGIKKSLITVIDNQTIDKNFENNIVVIMGENKLNMTTENSDILYSLAKLSSRLIFFQLENTPEKDHQDFILTAKNILDKLGSNYNDYIGNYVIDNNLVLKQNSFKSLASENNNIYLFDAPKNSMYTGGIVFPKINETLSPTSFDIAIDSLLKTTITSNTLLIKSLKEGVDKLGFLRSKPTKSIMKLLKDSVDLSYNNDLLIPKINKTEKYLKPSKINLKKNNHLEAGYLLTKEEANTLLESYKSVIPLVDEHVEKKQRKMLQKKYKTYYKQLNKLLFYKELQKKNTIAELLEIKTGIPVSDKFLNKIRLKDIAKKSKLSNKEYLDLMHHIRAKITAIETAIEKSETPIYIDGSKKIYYYLSKKSLL